MVKPKCSKASESSGLAPWHSKQPTPDSAWALFCQEVTSEGCLFVWHSRQVFDSLDTTAFDVKSVSSSFSPTVHPERKRIIPVAASINNEKEISLFSSFTSCLLSADI